MSKDKPEDSRNSIYFHAPVYGPVHAGSGDINLERLNYGVDEGSLDRLRAELLQNIDAASAQLAASILQSLNKDRLWDLKRIYDAIASQNLATQELNEFIFELRTAVEGAKPQPISLISRQNTEKVTEIIDTPSLSASHKFKLSIPIIPYLLSYETELGVDSKMKLEQIWDRLLKTLHIR
jgi:hypothetical protein